MLNFTSSEVFSDIHLYQLIKFIEDFILYNYLVIFCVRLQKQKSNVEK